MKTIKLKKESEIVVIDNAQVNAKIRTTDLIKVGLNSPVQGGYTISEIAFRIRLLDIVDKADKEDLSEIEIEDADYQALAKIIKDTKWGVVSKTILDFVTEFDNN